MRRRKPPNAPAACTSVPAIASKPRPSGKSSSASASSTVTASGAESRSAAGSATADLPRIRQRPPDSTSTVRADCGGSSASATRAACLGPAASASSDHPARSRMSTKSGIGAPVSSASSSKRGRSCWQAIIASPPAIAFAASSISVVQRAVWMRVHTNSALAPMASRSTAWLPRQSQRMRVLANSSSPARKPGASGVAQPRPAKPRVASRLRPPFSLAMAGESDHNSPVFTVGSGACPSRGRCGRCTRATYSCRSAS